MKIAILLDWHSEKMGYSDNFLPGALARLGHEVHVITSTAQAYFNSPIYKDIFEGFLGPGIVPEAVKKVDGYTLHRLPFIEVRHRVRIPGMVPLLKELKPDVVQVGELGTLIGYDAALASLRQNFRLFAECHIHASVFHPVQGNCGKKQKIFWSVYPWTIGPLLASRLSRCYPISSDAADIAHRFFGVPERKLVTRPLGVGTEIFRPIPKDSEVVRSTRARLGVAPDEVLCIYTGRLSAEKGPHLLAEAVASLRGKGRKIRSLFLGAGPADYVRSIRESDGAIMIPFVPVKELPPYYQSADVGVWPMQESTSQLDALACGLPLVLSDRVHVTERVDGCGLQYKQGDSADLAKQLEKLFDTGVREQMGKVGSRRIADKYSWDKIAAEYAEDYTRALHS